jgi:[FeFe] hydrogenase H-cluster maturation GTPase HydF
MRETPKGLRLHIGIFGRRNVGKSSLMNALTGQQAAIVSSQPGTTTDPVEKAMELSPLGPVLFVDTAGLDDEGPVGELRAGRSLDVLTRTDLALLVTGDGQFGQFEQTLADLLAGKNIPFVVVVNKTDLAPLSPAFEAALCEKGMAVQGVSANVGSGLDGLKNLLIEKSPEQWFEEPRLLGDLVAPGGLAVLVVPLDLGAPKGRLILPQVQAIRDILDSDASCLVVKERELADALENLPRRPDIVVCDSQVVLKASADTPRAIPLTTFSILMARFKGDLPALAAGAAAIDTLTPGDKVLIAEACTHHALADDISRVKIPRWINQYVGGGVEAVLASGKDYPEDLGSFKLVIHCGGCVITRRHMLSRMHAAKAAGVPVTNYGVAISRLQGVLERALEPFPAALEAFRSAQPKEVRNLV